MRIATIAHGTARRPVLVHAERGILPVDMVLPGFSGDAMKVLEPANYQAVMTAAGGPTTRCSFPRRRSPSSRRTAVRTKSWGSA